MSDLRLFQGDKIGNIQLKNRLIMAPMGNNFGILGEGISQQQMHYYEERAIGGVGLIITESCPVELLGSHGSNRIQVYSEGSESSLRKFAQMLHGHNTKIVMQLTHGGRKCSPDIIGEYPVAPSSLVLPKKDFLPRALSRQEIANLVKTFGTAARTAEAAGFDGVELLAASGHLIHQFLSPVSNRRTDCYGGSLKNRLRFLEEIITEIQQVTSLPVLVKIYGPDPEATEETWIPEEELVQIAVSATSSGAASLHLASNFSTDPGKDQEKILNLAGEIKKIVNVKIAMAGNILDPVTVGQIFRSQVVDFVELGRVQLADPDFTRKMEAGNADRIRPCLDCNHCRFETSQKRPICCSVNPYLGQEMYRFGIQRDRSPKKQVAIIGGGPAGIQTALCLSEMGHRGKIYEKSPVVGGLLWAASAAPDKQRIGQYLRYLAKQVSLSAFDVLTNTALTTSPDSTGLLKEMDAIVVAIGAKPYLSKVISLNAPNVHLAADVLHQRKKLGGTVVVLGGGQVGCEAADFLSEFSKCKVIIMSNSARVAKNVTRYERNPMLKRLGVKGVRVLVGASVSGYDGEKLNYAHLGIEKIIDCNEVILAKGWQPNTHLAKVLSNQYGSKVFFIGDAKSPGNLIGAMSDALKTSQLINEL